MEIKSTFAFPQKVKTIRSITKQISKTRQDDEVIGVLLKIEELSIG